MLFRVYSADLENRISSMRIDLEEPSEEQIKDQEESRPNLNAISSWLLIDEQSKHLEPYEGMEFESKEEAFSFYREYASFIGFSTIIKASRRSRISGNFIDAKFVCSRYGSKKDSSRSENLESDTPLKKKRGRISRSSSKTDCKAYIHVKKLQDGRWIIRNFVREHNHEMCNNVDALSSTRSRTKKMCVMSSKQSERTKKIVSKKNSVVNEGEKRLNFSEADMQVLLDYFMFIQEENPGSCYAMDVNLERRLRNVFWINAKARVDFESFGDVVFIDSTYIKNECKIPFVPFIGVNHHFQFILLGSALIADESKSTFIFAMRAWRRAMGGKAPKVILSDQEQGIRDAIAEVFPESRHCFCLWAILSKIQDKLSYVIRKHENFTAKFCKCVVKSGTEEIFEKKWWKMVDRFDLGNDLWIQFLYENCEKWVPVYMRDIFLGGMSTAQRPENLNSFDKCMQRKHNLKDFLATLKGILLEKYEDEARADFDTWHKQSGLKSPSPFGKQLLNIYTHAVFKKFQVEVLGVVACHPRLENKNASENTELYSVQDFEENRSFFVLWNHTKSELSCSCRLFEYSGYLCRHVMIVLQMSGVHDIPSRYILKRLTRDAKNQETQADFLDTRVERYSDITKRCFKLSDEGSLCQESYDIAVSALEEALRKCANKKVPSQKATEQTEPEVIPIGINDGWHQMGQSKLISTALDCSYELRDSMQGLDQLNSRVTNLDSYFSSQSMLPGMEQINDVGPSRDNFYENQPNLQGLGQLNAIAPVDDDHYLAQQRLHGLGQSHFRPQTIQSCFDLQDSLQDMHDTEVGSTPLKLIP